MKTRLLATFTLLASLVTGLCANPSLENFDQLYFKTNAPAPGIIQTRMNTSQFRAPILPGETWTITNVTGLTGASHWTNVAGVLQPVDGTSLLVTNLTATSNTVNVGTMTWLSKSILLTNGVNYLPSGKYSQLQLISPSTDPSLVQIVLSNGWSTVQHLEIFNLTNAVPSQGAFTLTNLTPIPDSLGGGVVKLINNEDWVATNGCGIELRFISPDWVEQFRSDVSGNPTFVTNYFNNVIINSNLTAHVIRINNTIITTNTLWATNVVGGVVTNLLPVDLTEQPFIQRGLIVGTNTETYMGGGLTQGETLLSMRQPGVGGDINWNEVTVGATASGTFAAGMSFLDTYFRTNQATLFLGSWPSGGFMHGLTLYSDNAITEFGMTATNNTVTVGIRPDRADGNTPYVFDTSRSHTSGNLLELSNNTTNRFTVDWSGIARANRFYAVNNLADSPGSTNGLLLSSAGTMFAYMNNLNTTIAPTYGLSLWNITDATAGSTNQFSPPLWWKGSWYDNAPHDLRVGLFLKPTTDYATSKLTMLSSTNNLSTFLTNFAVSANSGYDGTGNLVLTSDGTYKSLSGLGGGGNMTNSGASGVGYVPVATDVSGGSWTPTNSVSLATLTTSGTIITPRLTQLWGTPQNSGTNIVVDFASVHQRQFLALTNDAYFTGSNTVSGASVTVRITSGSTNRNLTYDTSYFSTTNWIGAPPLTFLASNHIAVLTFDCVTNSPTTIDVYASPSIP